MRYIRSLERKDIGLDTSMIPLGSCTMKLNAASEMLPITWPEFSKPHPFVPVEQTAGYQQIFRELEAALVRDHRLRRGVAAAELRRAGRVRRADGHPRLPSRSRRRRARDVVLIPASAHGTNPASAVMAGMRVVVVASTQDGQHRRRRPASEGRRAPAAAGGADGDLSVDARRLRGDASRTSARSCTQHGGQVYMDGANMNAQVGLTSPAAIGADVCHLNLHKTFSIPHGGGGPGMGPIGVAAHLAPYLPGHPRGQDRRQPGDSCVVGGAVEQRQHPADFVRLHQDARRRRDDRRDALRDPERELHQVAARAALSGALHAAERPRGARDDLRPAAAQAGERDRRDRRREAADGLRLPRADRVVPGGRAR